jgi:tetratricopeptide (TPR) repeat protein
MTERSAVQVLSLFDESTVPVGEAGLQWIPLRRRLGIGAFGTNAYRAAAAGDQVVEEHVESPGQEEMYVVVRGRAAFKVGTEEFDADAGTAVFVPDPTLRRGAVALEDGTAVIAVGGWRDRAYHSLQWEPIYLAQPHMRNGDWAEAAATLEREAGDHREKAFLRYRLAGCYARLGDAEKATAELRGALDRDPELGSRIAEDEVFAELRSHPDWPVDAGNPHDAGAP